MLVVVFGVCSCPCAYVPWLFHSLPAFVRQHSHLFNEALTSTPSCLPLTLPVLTRVSLCLSLFVDSCACIILLTFCLFSPDFSFPFHSFSFNPLSPLFFLLLTPVTHASRISQIHQPGRPASTLQCLSSTRRCAHARTARASPRA